MKNRLGFGSLIFIGVTALIALLGYLISPDPTPFSNQQYLELGLKKPATTIMFLPVKLEEQPVRHNIIYKMYNNCDNSNTYIFMYKMWTR